MSEAIDITLICGINKHDSSGGLQFLFNSLSIIHSVKIKKAGNWIEIPYKFNGSDSLLITAGQNILRDKDYLLKFDYSFNAGKLNDTALIIDRGNRWYPLIIDKIAPVKLTCEVPKGYKVLSTGNLTGEINKGNKSIFIWQSRSPVFKLPLIIFNPQILKSAKLDTAGNKIDLFYLPGSRVNTKAILSNIAGAMNYYNNILGNYPFNKLTLFEVSDFPGIDIGSGLIMIGTQSLVNAYRGDDDGILFAVTLQWFGANVFAKFGERGFFFFTISLPHYLRLMYIRNWKGEQAYNKSMLQPLSSYKQFAGKRNDIPILDVDFPNTKEKGLLLYAKGPYVLSKVENEIGKNRWLKFLKDLYGYFHGKIMTYNDFNTSLDKHDPNGRVIKLFNKLMTEKGLPE